MKLPPLLSIVIPAYNEEKRLPVSLEQLFQFLQSQTYSFEVIVVENGSCDRTYEIGQEYAGRYPNLRVLRSKERGKGRAVRLGMLQAAGTYRHFVGRGFNGLIRLLALPGLNDTQCGFKCFRGAIVEDLFNRQIQTGWSFDVELLFIARQLGYRIVEIPIPWYFNPESKIRVFHDSLQMGLDLLSIRLNSLRGLYARKIQSRSPAS